MKIAYFVNQYPKVSHTFIRREIRALEAQGFDIRRIALRGWTDALPDAEDRKEQTVTAYLLRGGPFPLLACTGLCMVTRPMAFLRVLRLALGVARRTNGRLMIRAVRIAEATRLLCWLSKWAITKVHVHFGTNSAEVAMYARHLGGPPYSVTIHGPEEFESPLALADKIAGASFIAAISSFCRSQLYARCATTEWPKIHVIRCGLESAYFHSRPATDLHQPAGAHAARLICVGRLCEAKGQLLLVEAVAKLRVAGSPIELVIAGDGPLRAPIEAAIRRHGIENCVRITGWISSDQVREEILRSRALVLPSFAEGLPVVIMEAMAMRRPVLSTYVAGIPELVVDGQTGWLFPAGSLDSLVAAIADCIARTASDINHMGDAARSRALALHAVDAEASKLAALLRREV